MGEHVATAKLETPIGRLRLAATTSGLVRIALPKGAGSIFHGWLRRELPDAERVDELPILKQACRELEEYFAGERREFKVQLDLRGTPFQVRVWTELAKIPFGQTWSYADVARSVRSPRGYRAVGLANAANPVPLILPCHRVIASDGKLGGYGGGLEAKRKLLAFEQNLAAPERLL